MLVDVPEHVDVLKKHVLDGRFGMIDEGIKLRQNVLIQKISQCVVLFSQNTHWMTDAFLFLASCMDFIDGTLEDIRMDIAQILHLFHGHAFIDEVLLHLSDFIGGYPCEMLSEFFLHFFRGYALVKLEDHAL